MSGSSWAILFGILCCGLPLALAAFSLGLRLACHLADATIPGFFKGVAVGAGYLLLLLIEYVLIEIGLDYLHIHDSAGQADRVVARLLLVPMGLLSMVALNVPILDVGWKQSGRIVLTQILYAGLFGGGFILFGLLRHLLR